MIRHERVRKKIAGTTERPRLCVYRSLNHIYTQIIDDSLGNTLVSASTLDPAIKPQLADKTKKEASEIVGALVAERAIQKGIKSVVFDRGGYVYTGRVAQLAEAARKAGLEF
jgi:large subunit ribosomal protein L18